MYAGDHDGSPQILSSLPSTLIMIVFSTLIMMFTTMIVFFTLIMMAKHYGDGDDKWMISPSKCDADYNDLTLIVSFVHFLLQIFSYAL